MASATKAISLLTILQLTSVAILWSPQTVSATGFSSATDLKQLSPCSYNPTEICNIILNRSRKCRGADEYCCLDALYAYCLAGATNCRKNSCPLNCEVSVCSCGVTALQFVCGRDCIEDFTKQCNTLYYS
ncbi:hypothetical protein HDE_02019 [Halotydeus destructor]|nr:hypothetical protein HDE_02019 [Halotydeus destructor]